MKYSGKENSLVEHTLNYMYENGLPLVGISFDRDAFCVKPDVRLLDTMVRYCIGIANWKHVHRKMIVICNYIFKQLNHPYHIKSICEGIT